MDFNRLPTRPALLDFKRRQAEDGFLFPLAATSIGEDKVFEARVRRLTTMDKAAIEALPKHVQEAVWSGTKEAQRLSKEMEGQDPQSLIEAAAQNQTMLPGADAFCIASFIDPVLVSTEAELASTPGAYLVDDIAAEDRVRFFLACLSPDSESARKLKMFRPKSSQSVPDREAGGLDALPTVGPVGDAN